MANTAEQQATSEMTDLFRLIIFHIPSIAGNQFVRTEIDKPDENTVTYTHAHHYVESDGIEYEIEITLGVNYQVTRKSQSNVVYTGRSVSGVSALTTPVGEPRCQYGESSGQCILPSGHHDNNGTPSAHEI